MAITVKHQINNSQNHEAEISCLKCSGRTFHKALVSVDESGSEGYGKHSFDWHNAHQIVQCLGCKAISYRIVSTNSEECYYDENDDQHHFETEKLYPPRLEGRTGLGNESVYLPHGVKQIYDETITALSVNSPILAGIGLRALLEQVCKEKTSESGDLYKKIDNLVDKRFLTPASATILHKIRTLGNAAAHEVKPHTDRQLSLAMDIVEHLLKDVYILPKQADAEF